MKDKQSAYRSMLMDVAQTMSEFAAIWFDNPTATALNAKINTAVSGMMQNAVEQRASLSTETKAKRRLDLQAALLQVAKGLRAYAIVSNRPELLKDANLTDNKLTKSSEVQLLGIYKRIADIATSYLLDLAPYGITNLSLNDLATKSTAFSTMVGTPAQQIQRRKEATARLEEFRKSGLEACQKLDHLMVIFEQSAPKFVEKYRVSRKLRNPPTRERALQLKITNVAGAPVADALVEIKESKLKRWSTAKGQVYVQHLKAGKHLMRVEAPGYPVHELEFKTTANVRRILVVKLGVETESFLESQT